jgi:hypothetical protein
VASTNAMDKAQAAFRKEEQQREGAKAMKEYLASKLAEEKKTERLRALRLAQEIEQRKIDEDAISAAPVVKKKSRKKKLS